MIISTASTNTTYSTGLGQSLYAEWVDAMRKRVISLNGTPMFTVDAPDIYQRYLESFKEGAERQYHTCNCCKQFIERYGNVVTVSPDGSLEPVMWHIGDSNEPYWLAANGLYAYVKGRGKIESIFTHADVTLGTPQTGSWKHFAVHNPALHTKRTMTAYQVIAEKREDRNNLSRFLANYSQAQLAQVTEFLDTDALYRSEKVLGQAQFLLELKSIKHPNLKWLKIAEAPAGFCHPNASMIGSLLEDLASGMDFAAVKSRFAAKMHPLAYQRPKAAPSDGAIDAAEKLFAQMGAERSLLRRYATLEDLELLWKPGVTSVSAGGVFGSLKKASNTVIKDSMLEPITWVKFLTLLDKFEKIEVLCPSRASYCTFVTAVDPDAPLLFQWDNPVSWYVYSGGSLAHQHGVSSDYHTVVGVTLQPNLWGGKPLMHHGLAAYFIISGAIETRNSQGLGLFPESLKSEYHGVRSVIEKFSSQGVIARPGSYAVGLGVTKNSAVTVRCTTKHTQRIFKIERWD